VKCGFLQFTLKDVTADFFYKLSNTSAATMIRENEKVPTNNLVIISQSASPIYSVMRVVGQNEKSTNLDTDFLTEMEGSFT
jgi:hypothetical protein